ncbi:MAG TPA: hypothetical protein PKE45_12725 [Caldilineaceae bacterium]|nr:hypothetical protein [Caldilineaceae bacterium]
MNPVTRGWRLGGYVGLRLATVYALLAALALFLQLKAGHQPLAGWRSEGVEVVALVADGPAGMVRAPFLLAIPLGMAWLAGAISGALTGLLAWLFSGRTAARLWGMFCFSIPPLVFHTAAELRPYVVLGEHWLNSYWFWVGLPSLIAVLIGGWVGEHLATPRREEQYV